MITTIQSFQRICLLLLGVAFISLAGCNKEEESFMATEVRLTGFNNTGEELEIQIDTIIYKNSRYYEKPTSFYPDEYIPFSFAYLYYSADNPVLTLKGKTTGKIYLEQPIKKGVLRQRYGFTYVNGENVYNPPAPDPNTNKVGFFLADPLFKDAIDIVAKTSIYISNPDGSSTIKEEKMVLVKDLKPFQWKYVDYTPQSMFASPDIYRIELSYYKSGTDIIAFPTGSEYTENNEIDLTKKEKSTFPVLDQRGRVVSYLISIEKIRENDFIKQFSAVDW
ncbi:hypothetical protein [Proteiniphilum sp. UBA1028]|jgi:hypothetical protein|uniref:hypothetical protein n=1 Tax=Proteiniphilum sp. UBA1028 TaxID=1947251 RepID=UPI0025D3B4F5|nr:hypothetical protein [Proteiniphilum sp. UBA1028]